MLLLYTYACMYIVHSHDVATSILDLEIISGSIGAACKIETLERNQLATAHRSSTKQCQGPFNWVFNWCGRRLWLAEAP